MIRISFSPDPPQAGKPLKICYDFNGSGVNSTRLEVTYDPPSGSTKYDVTPQNPCVTITCAAAKEIFVTDLDGPSDPVQALIT